MKFKTINILDYKCFKDLKLDCTKKDGSIYQWTVLLGNNNTGKTSILKAIANLRPALLKSTADRHRHGDKLKSYPWQ